MPSSLAFPNSKAENMTSTVTEVTRAFITSTMYSTLSPTLGIIAIVLLVVLLIERELLRASGGPRSSLWLQTLNIAIVPLLLTFGLVVIARLIDIMSR
jgi:hypothetical protein